MQAGEEELKETMAIAMTVGATKIRMLQENALAALSRERAPQAQPSAAKDAASGSEACSA
jgi:hypothetical protein